MVLKLIFIVNLNKKTIQRCPDEMFGLEYNSTKSDLF